MSTADPKVWFLLAWLGIACTPHMPAAYVRHADAAKAHTAEGRHEEAAREWAKAAASAERQTDRDEALYRQASSYRRAGKVEDARQRWTALAGRDGRRKERAAYDLALESLARDPDVGVGAVRETLVAYPASGLARGALDRWLAAIPESEHASALAGLWDDIDDRALREYILFRQARLARAQGELDEAIASYRRIELEHPYPHGRYWDEALLQQAVLLWRQSKLTEAIAPLERMLSQREQSAFVGSYERRYADAALFLAFLELELDWRKAQSRLRRFATEYPHSRHRDDALWASALLARERQEPVLACDAAATIRETCADSRYAPCVQLVCPESPNDGTCRDYVAGSRNTAAETLRATLSDLLGS